jgi:glycosyltransferase involved in cell wall biosynthesis
MPKVDVVMPAYNAAKYIPIALDSVIAQTFEDWRVLLIDDGSKDNTAEIVAPYKERLGEKLLYVQNVNGGPARARNTALSMATGEFIAFLDADDIWLPNRLMESLKSFEGRPQVGLSYGFVSRIGDDGVVIDTFADRQKHGEGRIAEYIYTRAVDMPCLTITLRRKCIDEVGMFDEAIKGPEDRDLWLRIAQRYEVALVPHLIAHYRLSPGSITSDTDKLLKAQRQFIEKHYGEEGCGRVARGKALSGVYKQRAETFGDRGQWSKALDNMARSLMYYPLNGGAMLTAGSLLLRRLGLRK